MRIAVAATTYLRQGLGVLVLAMLFLGACGTGKHMVVEQGQPKIMPRADKAVLVIMRTASFNGESRIDNYLDGKMIGQTLGRTYFITVVTPGMHSVISVADNTDVARVNFEPGRIYLLLQGLYPDWNLTARYTPMAVEEFQRELPETVFSSYDTTNPGKDLSPRAMNIAREAFAREVKEGGHNEFVAYRGFRTLK